MTYQQTIDFMYSKLPMFSKSGSTAIKGGLNNILKLCDNLGNPHQKGKFIHIAGTNGKGSVSHMLASILQSAGYKTGLYTSPHLRDFRERIKLDGEMIPESDVINFIEDMRPIVEEIKPSFFEITVAMAFYFFAKQKTDIAIIETGLGGRLDSTNIITPVISIITNIGYDHMQILGDTLQKIASEKAGIIKQSVPVVIGEKHPETTTVFMEKARSCDAKIFFASDNFHLDNWWHEGSLLMIEVDEKNKPDHQKYLLDLTAQYQTKNLITVLQSCAVLKNVGLNIDEHAIKTGLKHAKKSTGLHGRWETIHEHPTVITDVAHNESGIKALLEQLETTTYHKLHIILGMVKDKDIDQILPLLPKTATYYFANANIPRAMPAADLEAMAALHNLHGRSYDNVSDALQMALSHAQTDDLILVCGSVFLIGEIEKF